MVVILLKCSLNIRHAVFRHLEEGLRIDANASFLAINGNQIALLTQHDLG
jgi:hypothetical protein